MLPLPFLLEDASTVSYLSMDKVEIWTLLKNAFDFNNGIFF